MKKIIFFLSTFLLMSMGQVYATEQAPDILYYGKDKLRLDVGWGHPSPLEAYYRQRRDIKYPFRGYSTGNYRGHIATWKIEGDKFYLVEVDVNGRISHPKKFNIQSKATSDSDDKKVFADWFNGVLVCQKYKEKSWKREYEIYFHVRNGIIQATEKLTEKDFGRLKKFSEKDTADTLLMNQYSMLYLNQSYISYYFRLHDDEMVSVDDSVGRISGAGSGSIILEYFDNDHMKWIYNWENRELSGAPNGVWEIKEGKLFLKAINIHTGLEFAGADKVTVELSDVFKDEETQGQELLADWATGVYLITFGEEVADEIIPDYRRFKPTSYTFLRVNKGVIEESRSVPSDFDSAKSNDKVLKKLMKDYEKQ